MRQKIKILHLEDSPADAELIARELKQGKINFDMLLVDDKIQFENALKDFSPDVILCDHRLHSFDSHEALDIVKKAGIAAPFILVTASMTDEFAVAVMKDGADDYIIKDRLHRLPLAIINSIEKQGLEAERQGAHKRLEFHIENTPLGCIEWDNQGFAKSWSNRATEIFGWNEMEFIGNQESAFSQVYKEDLPIAGKLLEQLVNGEVISNKIQFRNITKDGRVIWCEWFNSVVKDKNGKVKTIMSLVQDITKEKLLETQKDDFLSMASHELNTPVTTIKVYGHIVEKMLEEKGDAETLDLIKRMGTQVNKLTSLIRDLLDITRIKQGKLMYSEVFFDFNELLHEVIGDMQKINLTHKIKSNSGKAVIIFGDKDKLAQVLSNLISNAIKYSPKAASIIINTKLKKDGIELSVKDFGIGILERDHKNIFQQFYRVTGNNQSTFPGLGIGLYICKEIITKEGGKIWVESTINKGSTFHILLPFDFRNKQAPLNEEIKQDLTVEKNTKFSLDKPGKKLIIVNRDLSLQNKKNGKLSAGLVFAKKELAFQKEAVEKLEAKLITANNKLEFQNQQKKRPADETMVLNTVSDISAMKKDEEYMRHMAAIIEFSDDAIISKSLEGTIKTWNPGSEKMFGYSAEEAIGKNISLIIPLEYIGEEKRIFEKLNNNEIIDHYETVRSHKNGEQFYVSLTVSPLKDRLGNIIGFSKIARDITPRKKFEAALIQANKELAFQNDEKEKRAMELTIAKQKTIENNALLESANKDLESFSYSVSHDLRAPLRAVLGYVRMLKEDYGNQLGTEAGRQITHIVSNATKMGQLIDDLLTFSRLGRKELVKGTILMTNLVTSLCREIESQEVNRDIQFKITELAPASGDPTTIKQVWVNLISNAVKYSRQKIKAVIEFSADENESEIIYSIKDNGAGFDMRYADKLFGVFQRLHADNDFEGTGVGLAIVHRIISKHGGRVWVEARVNEGAAFYFTLPKTPKK